VPRWESLSVRRGIAEPDGPYESVPAHLSHVLVDWLWEVLGPTHPHLGDAHAEVIPLRLRIPLGGDYAKGYYIIEACKKNEDVFLDVPTVGYVSSRDRMLVAPADED
jgi:hypothetical protein